MVACNRLDNIWPSWVLRLLDVSGPVATLAPDSTACWAMTWRWAENNMVFTSFLKAPRFIRLAGHVEGAAEAELYAHSERFLLLLLVDTGQAHDSKWNALLPRRRPESFLATRAILQLHVRH